VEPSYREELVMRPFPDGKVLSHFDFISRASIADWDSTSRSETVSTFHTSLLPRSLTSIVRAYDVEEVHLSLTSGRWDPTRWKDPLEHGSPSGGEISAWLTEFEGDTEATIKQQWTGLTNALGGLFCSSLNNLDSRLTTSPVQTFIPTHNASSNQPFFHALLPLERLCTENLTPFISLLPCRAKAGLAELLNPHKLFDANWQKLAIHVVRNIDAQDLEIRLEFEVVQDPVRMTLSAGSQARREFGFDYLFGRPVRNACPAASSSTVHVDLSDEGKDSRYTLEPAESHHFSVDGRSAVFDVSNLPKPLYVGMKWPVMHQEGFQYPMSFEPAPVLFERINSGFGLERARLGVEIRNYQLSDTTATWLEEWPWWIKVYMHTLQVTIDGQPVPRDGIIRTMRYSQAQARERPTVIEASLHLPANSVLRIVVDVDKAYLRYTDFPPDAMRGLDVPSGILLVKPDGSSSDTRIPSHGRRLYTAATLLDMPTPDFSMPYNVIIMTSTVMALFFGSVFNLLTRTWMIVDLEEDDTVTKEGKTLPPNAEGDAKAVTLQAE